MLVVTNMKSQDVFLLLKLVALGRHEGTGSGYDYPADDRSVAWSRDVEGGEPVDDPGAKEEPFGPYSARGLARLTGIGKSEVSNVMSRCFFSGLARPGRKGEPPAVNTRALLEFLVYGIRYVFPVRMQETTRGIATCLTAPIFQGKLHSGDAVPVWPYAKGNAAGPAVAPLYRTVPMAVIHDAELYAMLAAVDSIRLGLPRERCLAITELEKLLRG